MVANGILNSTKVPAKRWDCPDMDPEMVKVFLGERLRFPYASNVIAPNRVMKSAMSEQLATYDKNDMKKSGIPTRELINLYEKFADGGFGIVVTGCIMINGKDIEAPGNVIIDKELDCDERRNAFKEWTKCATRAGSIIIAQLFHIFEIYEEKELPLTIPATMTLFAKPGKYAADLPHKTDFNINKLTRKQIGELINEYAYAASYAQQYGFNGVEISCTYFFALGQLITSSDNTRNDEFGGELDNRARILFKIIQAIRMKICKPSRFVIGLKLFCGNFEPDYNNDEFGKFIHNVEKTGFDYIAITGGHYALIKDLKREDDPKKCEYFYQKLVLTMRKHLTRTKLFMNGGFVTLTEMIAAIRNGWAAGISLARPVAAEPGKNESNVKLIEEIVNNLLKDLPKRLFAGEVKSATKSLFDPMDYSVETKFAGSQLWQHGYLLTVMDASNPDHIEQFKKDLHLHEKQKLAVSNNDESVIGYPKTIVDPELLDEDILKRVQRPSKVKESAVATTLDEHPAETRKIDDTDNMLIEDETHHMVKKQVDYGAPGDLQENTFEESIHKVVKRHEILPDVGVDIIEETLEKVILTKSDFKEPSQLELIESQKHDAHVDDVAEYDTTKTLNSSFSDVKTVLEDTFKDLKLVGEVVKDTSEELLEDDDGIETEAAVNTEKQHEKTLSHSQKIEIMKSTEVISGLTNDDRPIISGIAEDAGNVDDDTVKSMEQTVKQESIENPITENEKQSMTDKELPGGDETYAIDENVVEEVMRKEIYDGAEMTTFMDDSMAHQIVLSPVKGDEQFTDASEFQDTGRHHEITKSTDMVQQDYSQDHSKDDAIGHTSEGVTEAYILKDTIEHHIPEGMDEQFLKRIDGIDMAKDLTDKHFHEDIGSDIKDDSLSEVTISTDIPTDGRDHVQEYPIIKDQHPGDFQEGGIDQIGLKKLSGEGNHYSVSSATYSTLFGSTLMGGNGEGVVYEEYYDKRSVSGQSPVETYHSEIYDIPSRESKDTKSVENISSEKVVTTQVQPGFDTEKSATDSSTDHRFDLTGFISSALPDSVQNLISSTRSKFDEMLSEGDEKHQPDLQYTMKTEEMMGDDGLKYEVHTESYNTDHRLSSDFGDTKAFLINDSDEFKMHDDNLTGGSTDNHYSIKTTITAMTSMDDEESKKHRDRFGDKKSTDELDFEFIH